MRTREELQTLRDELRKMTGFITDYATEEEYPGLRLSEDDPEQGRCVEEARRTPGERGEGAHGGERADALSE